MLGSYAFFSEYCSVEPCVRLWDLSPRSGIQSFQLQNFFIMKHGIFSLALLLGVTLMSSCVTKKKFAEVQSENSRLKSELRNTKDNLQQTEVSLASCQTNSKNLQERLAEAQNAADKQREAYAALQNSLDKSLAAGSQSNVNISKLVDEINASNKFIKQLVQAKDRSDSLNMALSNKLTRSLTPQESEDVNVQVIKGVVYISLADNMLYKSGSYEIGERAGETLAKIAKIISDYKDYDVLVEGNTDNVPISQKNIRNNWDLSTLRASSVVQALQNEYGIDPKRLTAAGRGEYNPIAENNTEVGRQRNRRTQIIITPKLDQFLDLIDQAPENE